MNQGSNPTSEPQKSEPDDLLLFDEDEYPFCRNVSNYEKMRSVGMGTFGEVYRARCLKTNKIVALKKFRMESSNYGVPISTLREIKILASLKHENIVSLIEVCRKYNKNEDSNMTEFYMVLEYCEYDLGKILIHKIIKLSLSEKKLILRMLFTAIDYLHLCKLMHRDIKTSNILVTKEGVLKLADFGLARPQFKGNERDIRERRLRYTLNVVTLWYRAPELLLGDRHYGCAIDIWSAGCVMMELWTHSAFLKGDTEGKQIELIINLCGSIDRYTWPKLDQLELFKNMKLSTGVKNSYFEKIYSVLLDKNAFDLASRALALYPGNRITAQQALEHSFFSSPPTPAPNLDSVMKLVEGVLYTNETKKKVETTSKAAESSCMYPSRIY